MPSVSWYITALKGHLLKLSLFNTRRADAVSLPHEKGHAVLHTLLICCIALAMYLPLIGDNPWNGNEPTRVAVAQDMLRTGNWITPTLHGKLYLTKPPLMNWLIAASGAIFGGIREWTSRLPSVFAMIATGLAVYFMTRQWLNRDSRFIAAIATISMTGLLKKGVSAEIDALFILFVAVILLVWLNGYTKGWRPVVLWGVSLFLVGIAFLTKGPHAAVFFYFTVSAYLLFRKRISFFFSKAHAAGIIIAFAVLLVYLSMVLQEITLSSYLDMWKMQITSRGSGRHADGFLQHLVNYPPDAAMSFMPWVLLVLPVLLHRDLRERARRLFKNELAVFSLVMIAVNFPLYWLLPNAYVRYFLPAGPFIAIVIAMLVDSVVSYLQERPETGALALKGVRVAAMLVCLAVPVIAWVALAKGLKFSLLPGGAGLLIVLSSGGIVLRAGSIGFKNLAIPVALWVGLFSLLVADMNMQRMTMRGESPRQAASDIKRLLPPGLPKVYEMGNRRILGVTCYLGREVVEVDDFGQLRDMNPCEQVYFLFDTDLLNNLDDWQRRQYEDLLWEKLSSARFEKGDNEIVLGRLKRF